MDGQAPARLLVADVQKGQPDFAGETVQEIYGKVSQKYCVYRTDSRIMVHFADDDALGVMQRTAILSLAPLRADVDAELEGWQSTIWLPRRRRAQERLSGLRRQLAQALILALSDNAELGKAQLGLVLEELRRERQSIARLEYLVTAVCTGIAFVLLSWLISKIFLPIEAGPAVDAAGTPTPLETEPGSSVAQSLRAFAAAGGLVLATGMAGLGAVFSISLAIRERNIQTDKLRRDNLTDSVLRMGTASISAVILFAMVNAGIVLISIGGTPLAADVTKDLWMPMVLAFFAGFSERLVGNILDANEPKVTLVKAGEAAGASRTGGKSGSSEDHPGDGTAGSRGAFGTEGAAADAGAPPPQPGEVEDEVDGCLCDHDIAETDLTDDADLPAADGGVEDAKS